MTSWTLPGARLRALLAIGLLAALAAGLAAVSVRRTAEPGPTAGDDNRASLVQLWVGSDQFGVAHLYPTLPGGSSWIADWSRPRSFSGVDPDDPWFDADHGSAGYRAGGGELAISGPTPRMYVHDPRGERQWRDIEATVYAKRIEDTGTPHAGVTIVARSNHLRTEDGSADPCDTRGYGGRLRFDGHTDFEKETAHPDNEAVGNVQLFPAGLPSGVWIGVKLVVFDAPDGVHLELWLDLADGRGGGAWRLVAGVVDDGRLFGRVPCAPGIDPRMALTGAGSRPGSESGKPNLSVYFRSDGIGPDGLRYKWASIREISP